MGKKIGNNITYQNLTILEPWKNTRKQIYDEYELVVFVETLISIELYHVVAGIEDDFADEEIGDDLLPE